MNAHEFFARYCYEEDSGLLWDIASSVERNRYRGATKRGTYGDPIMDSSQYPIMGAVQQPAWLQGKMVRPHAEG